MGNLTVDDELEPWTCLNCNTVNSSEGKVDSNSGVMGASISAVPLEAENKGGQMSQEGGNGQGSKLNDAVDKEGRGQSLEVGFKGQGMGGGDDG